MDLFQNLWFGFSIAVTPVNLGLCLIGSLVGTLIGVLPGIGPLATIAMLLPITFGLPPVGALIMLAGIYYGAQYGGSTTSILVNSRAAPAPRSRSPRSARSSQAASRPCWSPRSAHHSPRSR
jgi:TctA family transporter